MPKSHPDGTERPLEDVTTSESTETVEQVVTEAESTDQSGDGQESADSDS